MDEFKSLVKRWVQHNNTARLELAEHFECAQSTVDRWWLGTASPHPSLQRQVVEWIKGRMT